MSRVRRSTLRLRIASLPRLDGKPRRSLTSLNLRFEEKGVFDLVHAYWRLDRPLSQPDAFSKLLFLAITNPQADVPEEARAKVRR